MTGVTQGAAIDIAMESPMTHTNICLFVLRMWQVTTVTKAKLSKGYCCASHENEPQLRSYTDLMKPIKYKGCRQLTLDPGKFLGYIMQMHLASLPPYDTSSAHMMPVFLM